MTLIFWAKTEEERPKASRSGNVSRHIRNLADPSEAIAS